MKASDVITADLRNTLDDASGTQFPDSVLLGYLVDGVVLVRSEHPEARLEPSGRMVAVAQDALPNTASEFHMDAVYRIPLMHYVAHRAFASDAADTGDLDQAKLHRTIFDQFFA